MTLRSDTIKDQFAQQMNMAISCGMAQQQAVKILNGILQSPRTTNMVNKVHGLSATAMNARSRFCELSLINCTTSYSQCSRFSIHRVMNRNWTKMVPKSHVWKPSSTNASSVKSTRVVALMRSLFLFSIYNGCPLISLALCGIGNSAFCRGFKVSFEFCFGSRSAFCLATRPRLDADPDPTPPNLTRS